MGKAAAFPIQVSLWSLIVSSLSVMVICSRYSLLALFPWLWVGKARCFAYGNPGQRLASQLGRGRLVEARGAGLARFTAFTPQAPVPNLTAGRYGDSGKDVGDKKVVSLVCHSVVTNALPMSRASPVNV